MRRRAWWTSAAARAMSPRSCKQRFPAADVIGVDGSAAMLEKARATVPDCRFEQADFFQWQPAEAPDLIYSNAALHWVDRHAAAVPAPAVVAWRRAACWRSRCRRCTTRRCDGCQLEVAASGPWAEQSERHRFGARRSCRPTEYWDLLRPHVASLEMWQTTYMHALSGENAVLEWASGSSLRPFLDRLPDGAEGGVPPGLCRGRAAALSAPS